MEFTYKERACPDPVAVVGHFGQISFEATEFHVLDSLSAQLTEFDFAKECSIVGFILTKVGRRVDPIQVNNGGLFSSETKAIIQTATSGDNYLFTALKAKCSGDRVSREIGSLCAMIR